MSESRAKTAGRIIRRFFSWLLASLRDAAQDFRHLLAFGHASLRRQQAAKTLVSAQLTYGEKLSSSGLGDESLREQIAIIDDRIQSVKAAQGSVKSLETERRGLLIRLAGNFAGQADVSAEVRTFQERRDQAVLELEQRKVETQQARQIVLPSGRMRLNFCCWSIGFISALAIVGGWVVLPRQQKNREDAANPVMVKNTTTNPPLPSEYRILAKHLSASLSTNRDEPKKKLDVSASLAAAQNAILDLRSIASSDSDIQHISGEAISAISEFADAIGRLQSLPQPTSGGERFLAGIMYAFIGDLSTPSEMDRDAAAKSDALQAEGRKLVSAFTRTQSSQLLLTRVAKKYAGPTVAAGTAVLVDIDELWNGEPDRIMIANNSGRELHDVTVVVELTGKGGETRENVHFIPSWYPNQKMHGKYDAGIVIGDQRILRQTVTGIERAIVHVYARELSQERIQYEYVGVNRDEDIRRHLDRLTMYAKYCPYAPGVVFTDQRALIVSFTGIARLPKGTLSVVVEEPSRRLTESRQFSFDSWTEGEQARIEFPNIAWDPAKWDIKVQMADSKYVKTFSGGP